MKWLFSTVILIFLFFLPRISETLWRTLIAFQKYYEGWYVNALLLIFSGIILGIIYAQLKTKNILILSGSLAFCLGYYINGLLDFREVKRTHSFSDDIYMSAEFCEIELNYDTYHDFLTKGCVYTYESIFSNAFSGALILLITILTTRIIFTLLKTLLKEKPKQKPDDIID